MNPFSVALALVTIAIFLGLAIRDGQYRRILRKAWEKRQAEDPTRTIDEWRWLGGDGALTAIMETPLATIRREQKRVPMTGRPIFGHHMLDGSWEFWPTPADPEGMVVRCRCILRADGSRAAVPKILNDVSA